MYVEYCITCTHVYRELSGRPWHTLSSPAIRTTRSTAGCSRPSTPRSPSWRPVARSRTARRVAVSASRHRDTARAARPRATTARPASALPLEWTGMEWTVHALERHRSQLEGTRDLGGMEHR
eukprot:scaffold21391_cov67-Phaeocystis_antarctica.AAC.4